MNDAPTPPGLHGIHKRFAAALLREALAGAGRLHVSYRVDTEPEKITVWEPRRGANDPAPRPATDPDLDRQVGYGLLEAAGLRPTEVEIGGESEWIDLYFEPDPSSTPGTDLLGRMTSTPAVLSPSHAPMDERGARDEMRKALHLWTLQDREAAEAHATRPEMPAIWLISNETSGELQRRLGLAPEPGWPPGVYFGPKLLAVHAVVLRELPVTPETLLLRLLGTGEVLEGALAEQAALPADAPARRAAQAALLAVSPAEGAPVSIDEATKDPILRACRKTYQRWSRALSGG